MKSVLVHFSFFLSVCVLISLLNSADANVLTKHFDISHLFKSQFESHKISSFLVKRLPDKIGKITDYRQNTLQLTRRATVFAAGVISISPASIYDNDVAGGAPGIDRTITINNTGLSRVCCLFARLSKTLDFG
ncbi:MAG: hypothetical protein ABJA71_11175, partial [Ginsengibacter sp.]